MKKTGFRIKSGMTTLVLMFFFLSMSLGCMGNSATKMTTQYEIMGKALNQFKASGVKLCETEQLLSVEDCTRIKKIYNDTRRVYLITGDSLAFAIEVDGTTFKDPASQQYQALSKQFSELTLQWMRLVTELALIREERK